MIGIAPRCMTKRFSGTTWTLRFDNVNGQAILLDPNEAPARIITLPEAQAAFRLPSFSQSIKYLGTSVANIGLLEFSVSADGLRTVKQFRDEALVNAGGNSEITKLRKSGMWELLGGIALALTGVGVTVGGYLAASRGGGGRYWIMYGVVLWGIVMACRGGNKLSRAGRLAPKAVPGFAVLLTALVPLSNRVAADDVPANPITPPPLPPGGRVVR